MIYWKQWRDKQMNSKNQNFNNKSVWGGNDSPAESIYCEPDKTQLLPLSHYPSTPKRGISPSLENELIE